MLKLTRHEFFSNLRGKRKKNKKQPTPGSVLEPEFVVVNLQTMIIRIEDYFLQPPRPKRPPPEYETLLDYPKMKIKRIN